MPRLLALLAAGGLSSLSCLAAELFFDFTQTPLNQAPAGFESVVSGEGQPGVWRVIEDEVPSALPALTANAPSARKSVLAQLSRDPADEHYPILVYTNGIFGDFTFTTRLKCVAGAVEQMAGIVFRYRDPKNYYYVRASAKGGTFRFFKVVDGQRSPPIGPEIPIPAGVWHELSVQCKGSRIDCFFNGQQVIPSLTDTSFNAGQVGFWTKSDSVSHFTEARLSYVPREPFIRVLLREMKEKYSRVQALKVFAKTGDSPEVRVVASTKESDLGQAGAKTENEIFKTNLPYYGRLKSGVVVTLPLHDRNGEIIAALRVEMTSFPGQTENNAVARALPIAQDMEKRIVEAKDLF